MFGKVKAAIDDNSQKAGSCPSPNHSELCRTGAGFVRPLLFCSVLALSACTGSYAGNAAVGGLSAGAGGAAVGAIVGSVIANGNPAMSAAAGGAIGVPVGIALGLALSSYDDELQERRKFEQYMENQKEIMRSEREIQELERQIIDSRPTGDPKRLQRRRYHTGATLGQLTR